MSATNLAGARSSARSTIGSAGSAPAGVAREPGERLLARANEVEGPGLARAHQEAADTRRRPTNERVGDGDAGGQRDPAPSRPDSGRLAAGIQPWPHDVDQRQRQRSDERSGSVHGVLCAFADQ
jgi:hypothetical protein